MRDAGQESDESTNNRNQTKQAHRSICADISRDRRRCYEIREAGITFASTNTVVTCILVGMLAGRNRRRRSAAAPRDPERTRESLLQAASHEIYRSGFQSASLDTILASTGVTKGALYYHFKSKEALGYAVVEEVIAPDVHGKWVRPLQGVRDPIDALIGAVQRIPIRPEDVRGGCQLNNLAQEMSPLDAGFRKRLATIFDAWREAVASVLREGQALGSVRRDVEPADAAGLLIAMVEGYGSLAKNAQDPKVMKAGIRNIVDWLKSLRAPGNRRRG
jgi:TetR/AcrR family transcriptional regulator, transcriptional repressor for nem operon